MNASATNMYECLRAEDCHAFIQQRCKMWPMKLPRSTELFSTSQMSQDRPSFANCWMYFFCFNVEDEGAYIYIYTYVNTV